MPRKPHVLTHRLHKQSGQASVALTGRLGNRRDVLLGRHGPPRAGRSTPASSPSGRPAADASLPKARNLPRRTCLSTSWPWRTGNGPRRTTASLTPASGTSFNVRDVLRLLRELCGLTPAKDFGPLALKACRAEMVKKDWSRTYVNAQVDRIRRVFKWGPPRSRVKHPPNRTAGPLPRLWQP